MANTYKNLYIGQPALAGTVCITVGGSKQQVISSVVASNTDTVDHTIAYYINGTTNAFCIVPPTTIPAGGHFVFKVPLTLTATETFYAKADADTKVTVCVSGCEIS